MTLSDILLAARSAGDWKKCKAAYEKIVSDEQQSESVREQALLELAQLLADNKATADLVHLVEQVPQQYTSTSKAKLSKIIRSLVDILAATGEHSAVIETVQKLIAYANKENFQFLTRALETKLISIYLESLRYSEALALINDLLKVLKKLDDKPALVDVFLLESKCFLQLRNLPKARASLTSARTSANAIYCPPELQVELDKQSGTLHAEERDYKTSYSYFYEVAEGAFGNGDQDNAVLGVKYMILAKIMLQEVDDVINIVNGKIANKYKSTHIEAMQAISTASKQRSLHSFTDTIQKYPQELQADILVKNHLQKLYEMLLTSHILRVVEPYSRVQISHVAKLIGLDHALIERKLSMLILDGELKGVLDQSDGTLVMFEDDVAAAADQTAKKSANNNNAEELGGDQGIELYENVLLALKELDGAVDSLFLKSKLLRA
ncbi:hypothetical protein MIR68_000548 [Amoeboaphelidium protococcarum]|nr:hypothetical protein MIR68_000548 [Amoeboaphelidium protococcarum]